MLSSAESLLSPMADESTRLAVLRGLCLLDSPPDPMFETIAAMAARSLGAEIALVSLVDEHRQWFKARIGLEAQETPRDQAFCAHAIRSDEVMVVPDAQLDRASATTRWCWARRSSASTQAHR